MNEILFFLSALLAYLGVSFVGKYFGKSGLFAWIAIATILANIAVTKQVTMFGMDVTLGNIMFSSVFLATDILTEVYGVKEAKKSVFIGLTAAIIFVIFGIVVNTINPCDYDIAGEPLKTILSFSARTTLASVGCFFLANLCDVYLFNKIRNRSKKNLWLRNNVCTIACNCIENFLFIFIAMYGVFNAEMCFSIALYSCVMEIIAGLLDTPFVYLGRKWVKAFKE